MEIRSPWISLKPRGHHHDNASLLGMTRCHCLGSIRQFPDPFYCPYSFSIVRLIQTAALVHRTSYDIDSPFLTRRTYLSDHGPCTAMPVYKCPVFRQSSPKLDLILNINVLESSPCASPFPHLLHKPLRIVSSNTRDFYYLQVLTTSSLLVQVVLSRPVEALTLLLLLSPVRHHLLLSPAHHRHHCHHLCIDRQCSFCCFCCQGPSGSEPGDRNI